MELAKTHSSGEGVVGDGIPGEQDKGGPGLPPGAQSTQERMLPIPIHLIQTI